MKPTRSNEDRERTERDKDQVVGRPVGEIDEPDEATEAAPKRRTTGTPDLREEPPPPRTDDPAKDKAKVEDGVIQPLPAAD